MLVSVTISGVPKLLVSMLVSAPLMFAAKLTAVSKYVGTRKKNWTNNEISKFRNLLFFSRYNWTSLMPYRKISQDVKLAAIRLYEGNFLELEDILDCLRLSRRTFYHILHLWRTTGDVIQRTHGIRGRRHILHFDDIDYLKRIIQHRPDWFLDELQDLLQTNRFISVHYTTIHRELEWAGVSTKKLKKIALERNENLQADFIRHMGQYEAEQLGFLDEMSKDERTSARRYGRAHKGSRAIKKGVFVRGRRFSAEGLLTVDGMVLNTVVEGSMTRAHFLEYLEHSVVRCATCLPFIYTSYLSLPDAASYPISRSSECASYG